MPAALAAGCVSTSGDAGRISAAALASSSGFTATLRDAGGFSIATWQRFAEGGDQSHALHVYIEGDGNAWATRKRISDDPTPTDPVAFRLAAADSTDVDVLYLARPCQFVALPADNCVAQLWTGGRFSAPVVQALNAVVDQVSGELRPDYVVLAGYSGGGVVAALMAARRSDVRQLVTVAAPLDHEAWTAHHNVSPLSDSLSPMHNLQALRAISQIHFAGGSDTIVPSWVVSNYLNALARPESATLQVQPGFDHVCCWASQWPALMHESALRHE